MSQANSPPTGATMNDKSLMKLMIECPNFVRSKVLTDRELEMFDKVRGVGRLGMTSSVLASLMNISVQNASSVLSKLNKKGYLNRTNEGAASGGDEYVYRATI